MEKPKMKNKIKEANDLSSVYLEYSEVTKLSTAPLTTLLNVIKLSYKDTPEVYRMLLAILMEYQPTQDNIHKEKIQKHIRILLQRKVQLANSLMSMLPDRSSMTINSGFVYPLQSLPSNLQAVVMPKTLNKRGIQLITTGSEIKHQLIKRLKTHHSSGIALENDTNSDGNARKDVTHLNASDSDVRTMPDDSSDSGGVQNIPDDNSNHAQETLHYCSDDMQNTSDPGSNSDGLLNTPDNSSKFGSRPIVRDNESNNRQAMPSSLYIVIPKNEIKLTFPYELVSSKKGTVLNENSAENESHENRRDLCSEEAQTLVLEGNAACKVTINAATKDEKPSGLSSASTYHGQRSPDAFDFTVADVKENYSSDDDHDKGGDLLMNLSDEKMRCVSPILDLNLKGNYDNTIAPYRKSSTPLLSSSKSDYSKSDDYCTQVSSASSRHSFPYKHLVTCRKVVHTSDCHDGSSSAIDSLKKMVESSISRMQNEQLRHTINNTVQMIKISDVIDSASGDSSFPDLATMRGDNASEFHNVSSVSSESSADSKFFDRDEPLSCIVNTSVSDQKFYSDAAEDVTNPDAKKQPSLGQTIDKLSKILASNTEAYSHAKLNVTLSQSMAPQSSNNGCHLSENFSTRQVQCSQSYVPAIGSKCVQPVMENTARLPRQVPPTHFAFMQDHINDVNSAYQCNWMPRRSSSCMDLSARPFATNPCLQNQQILLSNSWPGYRINPVYNLEHAARINHRSSNAEWDQSSPDSKPQRWSGGCAFGNGNQRFSGQNSYCKYMPITTDDLASEYPLSMNCFRWHANSMNANLGAQHVTCCPGWTNAQHLNQMQPVQQIQPMYPVENSNQQQPVRQRQAQVFPGENWNQMQRFDRYQQKLGSPEKLINQMQQVNTNEWLSPQVNLDQMQLVSPPENLYQMQHINSYQRQLVSPPENLNLSQQMNTNQRQLVSPRMNSHHMQQMNDKQSIVIEPPQQQLRSMMMDFKADQNMLEATEYDGAMAEIENELKRCNSTATLSGEESDLENDAEGKSSENLKRDAESLNVAHLLASWAVQELNE